MADVHTKEIRSYNMSQIRSKNTKPELVVRKYLFAKGLRFRLHRKDLPGKPDIVLPKYKTVIFVHGCFWHAHKCKKFKMPTSKRDYWIPKLEKNVSRDRENIRQLRLNWKVIVIWECKLKKDRINKSLSDLYKKIIT